MSRSALPADPAARRGGGLARAQEGRARASFVLALLAAALLGAGCGVPASASPRTIPRKQVPFGLLTPATTSTVPPPALDRGRERFRLSATQIFLVDSQQRLFPVTAYLTAPLRVRDVVAELLNSPTLQQAASGLTSDVSDHARLLSDRLNRRRGVMNLDFSPGISTAANGDQVLAVAQIVYTATAVPGVSSVTISIDGKRVEVPVGNGSSVERPVSRRDYGAYAPKAPQSQP